jgi:hypothetical protein
MISNTFLFPFAVDIQPSGQEALMDQVASVISRGPYDAD